MNLADFTGQRPCPFGWRFLAWAVRPTPPQNLVKGMACLWAITSSRYLLALPSGSFLSAWAVSRVFCFPKTYEHTWDIRDAWWRLSSWNYNKDKETGLGRCSTILIRNVWAWFCKRKYYKESKNPGTIFLIIMKKRVIIWWILKISLVLL